MEMKHLIEKGMVDVEKLILEQKINLSINLEQLGFLLLFYRYTSQNSFLLPSVQQFAKIYQLDIGKVKELQNFLFQKGFCEIDTKTEGATLIEYVKWDYLYQRLNEQSVPIVETNETVKFKMEIVQLIEREFGRMLSPFEIELVTIWTNSYQREDILEAIKEAVISGVQNMRYIDKILLNWSQGGKRKREFSEEQGAKTENVSLDQYYNWLEKE